MRLLLILLLFGSCDKYKVERGIVTGKQFLPESTKIIETNGEAQNIYYNPKWYLVMQGVYKGDTIREFHEVTQEQYENVDINDSIQFYTAQ